MCATFEIQGRVFRPGREVLARSRQGLVRSVWAGFARNESLDWWLRRGGVLLDVPADRFAERSDLTRRLVWDNVPGQLVIRGLLDMQATHPLLKVVTRASTRGELERFQHPRMPLLAAPLFGPIPEGLIPPDAQAELF
jgi:hypothetical protein